MTEDQALEEFGLRPSLEALNRIRELLLTESDRERQSQGAGDTELMKLLCVQLFSRGLVGDVLRIWHAKTSSFDSDCSFDVQLLCGPGLQPTKRYLEEQTCEEARSALARIAHGDFEDFSPETWLEYHRQYYGLPEPDSGR